MAATTKKSDNEKKKKTGGTASRSSSSESKSAKARYQAEIKAKEQRRRQFWALMLFALGLINIGVTYIKGENLWSALHDIQFGLLGWVAYAVAPAMIFVAVMLSLNKIRSAPVTRIVQMGVLILLLCSVTQLFSREPIPGDKFTDVIATVYDNGVKLSGGGVLSLIFAWPLTWLGVTPARVTVLILLFVMVMLITGLTIADLMRTAYKPVKKIEETYSDRITERDVQQAAQSEPYNAALDSVRRRKFEYDIDINDDVPQRPKTEKPAKKTRDDRPPAIAIGQMDASPATVSAKADRPPFEPDLPPDDAARGRRGGQSARDRLLGTASEDLTAAWTAAMDPKPTGSAAKPAVQSAAQPAPEIVPQPDPEPEEDNGTAELEALVSRAVVSEGKSGDGRFRVKVSSHPKRADTEPEPAAPAEKPPALSEEEKNEEKALLDQAAKTAVPAYKYPPIDLLTEAELPSEEDVSEELKKNAENLVDTLNSFGVQTRIINISRGPTVTRYELQPSAGVKISKITGLADDIALNLAAAGVRIEAPIPNKAAVGIEVPNKVRRGVSLREIIDSDNFRNAKSKLTAAVGLDITGRVITADLAKMPHLLIAGSTGSGKSVCMNSFIVSLIYKASPEEVRLIMIDPKVVEFNKYNGLPHLLIPVVTDPRKAAGALGWAVSEMMNRYKLFADNGVNDIRSYNSLAESEGKLTKIPQVVIIIDELSDLMMAAPNEVEDYICRLAQMARAAGMHMVIATQRPSVNVITGVIKANIPSRIALMVSSYVDSRTILDTGGAEKLLGNGDMLFHPAGSPKPTRIQGCFISDEDVKKIIQYVSKNQSAEYDSEVLDEIEHSAVVEKGAKASGGEGGGFEEEDPMLPAAIECVIEMGQASTSMLQRKLKLGYSRAGRLMDEMEQRGIVGPFEGSKARAILITRQQWLEMKGNM